MSRIHNESSSFNHYPTEKHRINRRYVILEIHEITQIIICIYRKIIILIIHNVFIDMKQEIHSTITKNLLSMSEVFFHLYAIIKRQI